MNKYKCKHCDKILERDSTKQWVESYCVTTQQCVKLQLIKKASLAQMEERGSSKSMVIGSSPIGCSK